MRQVAAFVFRTRAAAPAEEVEVLLVTSRGTKRWVLPKGNIPRRLAPHLAAAREAEEEAGVLGTICPVPLGRYRYLKRRNSGTSVMADVDVYPLAFDRALDTWPEQHERTRRWFTLDEAAGLVDEAPLKEMIRSFSPDGLRRAEAGGDGAAGTMQSLIGWFHRLPG